jgi:hypothetical protein
MKYAISIVLCALLAACGAKPHDAQTAVYQVVAEYDVAVHAAVAYRDLPACTKPKTAIVCSDPAIVAKLQQAYRSTYPAIQQAEAAVRDPNFNASTASTVLISAQAALAALTAITATLGSNP